MNISDIYTGKPDAKDEVETDGIGAFLENYVVPENFNVKSLIDGTRCFITGYKGTGKTALLYYLDNCVKERDESACSSYVFFKGDYSDLKKQEMEYLSKRLVSAISISNDVVLEATDFEYIWRWLFYRRLIEDNEKYNNRIFVADSEWRHFVSKIDQIKCEKKKNWLSIPSKINMSMKMQDPGSQITYDPSLELDFASAKVQETKVYKLFVKVIDEADELFAGLHRTDVPYYMFIDELEAYYGDSKVFYRDLRLIRDLIFTVKKMNRVLSAYSTKTKMICSVRTEIINAINEFIVSKEINKVTSGFEAPIVWDYTNTNSFSHPILKVLIKRIEYGERTFNEYKDEATLIQKWFPERLNGVDPANYILNNTWYKPRDIVRLIAAAQNGLSASNQSFSQKTIDMCRKKYSTDSLIELKEELRALYSAEEIDKIISCLTGFKRIFSIEELRARIDKYFSETLLKDRLTDVLTDLYRLGIVGNILRKANTYRWQHKGDEGIIIDENWQIIIHSGLLAALSVNNRQDHAIAQSETQPKPKEIVEFTVTKIIPSFGFGNFQYLGEKYNGSLHISEIDDHYIKDIHDYLKLGNTYKVKVVSYDSLHRNWVLTMKNLEES